jgi:hypothetical protein
MWHVNVLLVVLAALAVLVPTLLWLREQRRKALAVALVTNRALVTSQAHFPLKVTYDRKVIAQPRIVVLAVANLGNVPVEAADFETALKVEFRHAQLLDATVARTRPHDLSAALTFTASGLALAPLLLNPGDGLEIQCLVDGRVKAEDLLPGGRISGVASVPLLSVPRTSWNEPYRTSRSETAVSLVAVAGLLVLPVIPLANWPPDAATYAGATAALLAWGWIASYALRRARRSRLFLPA